MHWGMRRGTERQWNGRKRGHHRHRHQSFDYSSASGWVFTWVWGAQSSSSIVILLYAIRRHHCHPQSQSIHHVTTQPHSIPVVVVTCGYDESANNIFAHTPQTIRDITHTHTRATLSREKLFRSVSDSRRLLGSLLNALVLFFVRFPL